MLSLKTISIKFDDYFSEAFSGIHLGFVYRNEFNFFNR